MNPAATATPLHAPDEIFNVSTPRAGLDEYAANPVLVEAVERYDGGWASERLHAAGRLVGSEQFQEWAELANRFTPELVTHDRYGHRIDEVRYHPAYHSISDASVAAGTTSLAWASAQTGSHLARQALQMLFGAAESGHACPVTMTHAAVPALRVQPELAAEWVPRILGGEVLFGMGMTERQGGSDVRANTSVAVPVGDGGPGAEYRLTGHKWFCSAPMSDAFLVLAQTPEGVSCFLMPRLLPDGERNAWSIVRLKDKLGNKSNASSEISLDGAWARMVGEPGRGVRTIVEMVNQTRLDCAGASAALMHRAASEARWNAERRSAFGRRLVDQPLMTAVLADLALEAEAAVATTMRLAHAYDTEDPGAVLFRRIGTAIVKYWNTKRGPAHAFEALECLGGNGYVETFPLARIYREQPVLSVWEGSGNVICLDVLRSVARTPEVLTAFLAELELARGEDRRYDAYVDDLTQRLPHAGEANARVVVERLALALQASVLLRHSPTVIADAFVAARLAEPGHEYGALPGSVDPAAVLAARAL